MADWVFLGLTLGIFLLLLWFGGGKEKSTPVPDDPSQPYTSFCSEFDIECLGRDVFDVLDPENSAHYPGKLEEQSFETRVQTAIEAYDAVRSQISSTLKLEVALKYDTIAILLDQSGSVVDDLPVIAAQLRALCDVLTDRGVNLGLFGHTTRGWRGGQSRMKWLNAQRPPRPGRLADLLHIVYKDFGSEMTAVDWEAMLLPNACCENIDGEAIEWIAQKLRKQRGQRKALLVISDGASVDDSTLSANGNGFLERHLLQVIKELNEENAICLKAIGLDIWVDGYYEQSTQISEPEELVEAAISELQS